MWNFKLWHDYGLLYYYNQFTGRSQHEGTRRPHSPDIVAGQTQECTIVVQGPRRVRQHAPGALRDHVTGRQLDHPTGAVEPPGEPDVRGVGVHVARHSGGFVATHAQRTWPGARTQRGVWEDRGSVIKQSVTGANIPLSPIIWC